MSDMQIAEVCQHLAKYTSCDVADALVDLGVPNGGIIPDITLWSPLQRQGSTTIVGPAYTVRYDYVGEKDTSSSSNEPHFVDGAPNGSIIFMSCPPGFIHACWGGLTTRRAQKNAVAGTVVDGRIRDLDELRELQFPVFARNIAPTPPRGTAYVSKVNGSVSCQQGAGDVTIHPGDILVGDSCGVVCVPQTLAGVILGHVEAMVAIDSRMTEAINEGMSMTEASKFRQQK